MSDATYADQGDPRQGEPRQTRQELVAYVSNELKRRKKNFIAALPAHIPAERFLRCVVTAINLNADLLRCDERSFWNACYKAASDGLYPDGREGALVPFDGEVSWIPMVQGIRKKARNSGEIATWDVVAVHAKDAFDYQLGDKPFIAHKPYRAKPIMQKDGESDEDFAARSKENRNAGPLTDVYSVCTLKSGFISREVMARADVEYVRDTWSKKSRKTGRFSPMWEKSFDEAAKKTIARRHSKVLPMSTDLDDLLRRDDALYDMEGKSDKALASPKGKTLDERLDMLLDGIEPLGPVAEDRDDQQTTEQGSGAGSGSRSETAAATQGSVPPIAVVADGGADGGKRDSGASVLPDEPEPSSVAAPAEAPREEREGGSPAGDNGRTAIHSPQPEGSPPRPAEAQETPSQKRARIHQALEAKAQELIPKGYAALRKWLDELDGDETALLSFKVSRQWEDAARAADKARPRK